MIISVLSYLLGYILGGLIGWLIIFFILKRIYKTNEKKPKEKCNKIYCKNKMCVDLEENQERFLNALYSMLVGDGDSSYIEREFMFETLCEYLIELKNLIKEK